MGLLPLDLFSVFAFLHLLPNPIPPSSLQVWRTLTRSVQRHKLPTCNANIQRERAEIWVFCDVVHAEQVGRFLKDQLQLSGSISLSVHRLGDVFRL